MERDARPSCPYVRRAGEVEGEGADGSWREAATASPEGKVFEVFGGNGGRSRIRTYDPLIKSQLLYQLSYAPARPEAVVCLGGEARNIRKESWNARDYFLARRDISGAVDFAYLEGFAMDDSAVIDEVLALFREQAALWTPMLDKSHPGW